MGDCVRDHEGLGWTKRTKCNSAVTAEAKRKPEGDNLGCWLKWWLVGADP
jgi:hypothetical protein